ncbi:MAG: UDP-N-acetylglucosamine 2-epimerase (non-hydrolyzing) [Armatimonadetes bacterium]|nr:UDP-N-acetylglucosamine 2-epimerase (non-hydrolyzing) [Armatimonadota bacterium]
MVRVLTVVGARPQFIKAAAVSRAFSASGGVEEKILHTGQHYDDAMSDQFFRELQIPAPAYNLEVGSASHGAQTGRMLEGIESVLLGERPDWVLVYGDTNSTTAGALAAAKLHVPVAHVEAGLRSFNRRMPEEFNRIVTDHLSDICFAPTAVAVGNLAREGISGASVIEVGDVMYDAALAARDAEPSARVQGLDLESGTYVLATVHRAESTDDPDSLRAIFEGLAGTGRRVVLPLHPRTKKAIADLSLTTPSLEIIEPVGYLDMAHLTRNAGVVATDSGGLQKEAYFHGVPCVTLRTETEWVELVDMGWNILQPPSSSAEVSRAVLASFGRRGRPGSPYGDGKAAEKIVEALKAGRLVMAGR